MERVKPDGGTGGGEERGATSVGTAAPHSIPGETI